MLIKTVLIASSISSLLMGSGQIEGQETTHTFHNILNMSLELGQLKDKTVVKKVEVKPKRPVYENIPLSDDILDYIWTTSKKYGFEYELILGLIKAESNFDPKVISYSGTSRGLLQLNSNTYPWIAKELNIKNFNVYNPYHNVNAGVWYLSYLRQQWLDKGYSMQESTNRALLSYNRGESGARRYISTNGTSRSGYTKKVFENRNKLKGDR